MRVLVTGAAGFIGSWAMKELPGHGLDVSGTDKEGAEGILRADITDLLKLLKVFEFVRPDAVIHLAAISGSTGKNEAEQSLRQPYLNFHVNSLGTLNVAEACRMMNVPSIVYLSTFAVYGRIPRERLPINEETQTNPEHAYAVSKLEGEETLRTYSSDFGITTTIIRAPFVVGEHQRERNVVREFIDSASKGQDLLIFGDGSHVREFIHPSDLAAAFAAAVRKARDMSTPSDLFIVGNTPITMRELASKVVKEVGRGSVVFDSTSIDRTFDQRTDFAKARQLLSWEPKISIDEIIHRVVATEYSSPKRTD